MAHKTRRDWLEEGLAILAEVGAPQLTIDALLSRLNVTKGSFYHHFANYHAFKKALLDYYEEIGTLRIIALTEHEQTPAKKLTALREIVLNGHLALDVAIRAWALQDAMVHGYQQRIDEQRIAYIYDLCRALLDDQQGLVLAQMIYAIYVGSHHIVLPIQGDDLRQIYERCLRAFGL